MTVLYHSIIKSSEGFLYSSVPLLFSSPPEILPQGYVKALSGRSLRLTVYLYLVHILAVSKTWKPHVFMECCFNPLNAELNPICYLLALSGFHHFLHVSRIRVKSLTLRLLMSHIYGAPILDVSRSHTTTHHSR